MWMTYSEPQYLEITDEWREKFERFREEHANDPEGNVANVILYEDDNLRIWEMKLEPGECSDLHTDAEGPSRRAVHRHHPRERQHRSRAQGQHGVGLERRQEDLPRGADRAEEHLGGAPARSAGAGRRR
jgi:hypothetical protein